MKSYIYYPHPNIFDRDILLDKINELGHTAQHIICGDTFQVYMVEIDSEDLMLLKLTIPSLEIDLKDHNV